MTRIETIRRTSAPADGLNIPLTSQHTTHTGGHTGTTSGAMIHLSTARLLAGIVAILLMSPSPAQSSDHSTYCSGMYHCLQEKPEGCSDEECLQHAGIRHSDAYCAILKDLHARGLRSTSAHGRQIYRQVSGKHRVEYALNQTLPMPAAVMIYLMDNLPFSAQLINAYQGTNFQIRYLDSKKKRFTGSGENISGSFTTVLQNKQKTCSLYHGFGTTEILAWRLSGTALILFDFKETRPREITYSLRCMVFPHSAFVKSILNFFLFRRTILGLLDRTTRYIQESALAFYRGERTPIKNHPAFCTPEGQQQVEAFTVVLQRAMGSDKKKQPQPFINMQEHAEQSTGASGP